MADPKPAAPEEFPLVAYLQLLALEPDSVPAARVPEVLRRLREAPEGGLCEEALAWAQVLLADPPPALGALLGAGEGAALGGALLDRMAAPPAEVIPLAPRLGGAAGGAALRRGPRRWWRRVGFGVTALAAAAFFAPQWLELMGPVPRLLEPVSSTLGEAAADPGAAGPAGRRAASAAPAAPGGPPPSGDDAALGERPAAAAFADAPVAAESAAARAPVAAGPPASPQLQESVAGVAGRPGVARKVLGGAGVFLGQDAFAPRVKAAVRRGMLGKNGIFRDGDAAPDRAAEDPATELAEKADASASSRLAVARAEVVAGRFREAVAAYREVLFSPDYEADTPARRALKAEIEGVLARWSAARPLDVPEVKNISFDLGIRNFDAASSRRPLPEAFRKEAAVGY